MGFGTLPGIARNNNLRRLAVEDILAEEMLLVGRSRVIGQRKGQRSTCVVVPDLSGVGDAMPDGVAVLAFEEVVNKRAGRSVAFYCDGVFECLAVIAFFDVGLQAQLLDNILGRLRVDVECHGGGQGRKGCDCREVHDVQLVKEITEKSFECRLKSIHIRKKLKRERREKKKRCNEIRRERRLAWVVAELS